MAEVDFGSVVVYNGGEGKAHELALVADPGDGNVIARLFAIDDDGNWQPKNDVPRRAPADFEAGGGGGHTWHLRSEDQS